MGSKRRIAKYILPIILKDREQGQWYIEPFVGGANLIDKVGGNRIGADSNKYLISLLNALSQGWVPPLKLSEEEYKAIKNNKDGFPPELVGYAGIPCSYAAKWFGGYCRSHKEKRDYIREAHNNCVKQSHFLKDIKFITCDYQDMVIPQKSIIYCDPPYKETTKYKSKFNHENFFEWCRSKADCGHSVFISEYQAPNDFKCVWKKEIVSSLTKETGAKKGIEKLFIYDPLILQQNQ